MSALIPPSALEGLMRKVFLDRSLAAGLFWDALLKADLFIPLAEKNAAAAPPTAETDVRELPLLLGIDDKGTHVAWLFTSSETLVDYTERDLPYVQMNARSLLTNLMKVERDVVLIGPDGLTLRLHPDLMKSLSEGVVPDAANREIRYVPKEATVSVGPAQSEQVTALEGAFATLFGSIADVKEARFIQISDDAGPRLLLGLRLDENSRERLRVVAELVAKAAEGILPNGDSLDITLLDGSLKEAFNKHGKAFYSRQV
jgi:hypothetical protein